MGSCNTLLLDNFANLDSNSQNIKLASEVSILLVNPKMGFSGVFVQHIPLGIIYTATESYNAGYDIEALDLRIYGNDDKQTLKNKLINKQYDFVGFTVWSGSPIEEAVELGKIVRKHNPNAKILWGGPHATFHPINILEQDWDVDYVISGYGSKVLKLFLDADRNLNSKHFIPGLSFIDENGKLISNKYAPGFEDIDFNDIPYDLINNYDPYGQFENGERIFSLYSVHGCPYKCSFCSSPAQYSSFKKKAQRLDHELVVDHIEYLVNKYKATYIYFIDDDSFISLKHVEAIIDEINIRKLKVKLGFRGARINEIKRMSHAFLEKLVASGTDIMHVGVESGSDKILELIRKDCTVDDIIECVLKLSKVKNLKVFCNFIVGLPGETLDELKKTASLMLKLTQIHKNAIIGAPNKFRPLPGTELFDLVQSKWNYKGPETSKEWSEIEVEGDYSLPWLSKKQEKFIKMMLVTSYFIDDKINKFETGNSAFYKLIKILSPMYRPFAKFRLKYGITIFLFEYNLYRMFINHLTKIDAPGSS